MLFGSRLTEALFLFEVSQYLYCTVNKNYSLKKVMCPVTHPSTWKFWVEFPLAIPRTEWVLPFIESTMMQP